MLTDWLNGCRMQIGQTEYQESDLQPIRKKNALFNVNSQ